MTKCSKLGRGIRLPVISLVQRSWVTGREVAEDAQSCSCLQKTTQPFNSVLLKSSGCFRCSPGNSCCLVSYRCLHLSDKCVLAGRLPKATRWHGSRCDPCESGQHCMTAVGAFFCGTFLWFASRHAFSCVCWQHLRISFPLRSHSAPSSVLPIIEQVDLLSQTYSHTPNCHSKM